MELRLLDEQGQPVPPGAVVRISGQEGAFLVGFDGRTYVSGLAARNRVTAAWADRRCTFDLTFAEEIDATTQVCRDDPR